MTAAHEAAINGEKLSAVDSRVVVMGASTDAAKITQSTVALFGRPGGRNTAEHRDYLDITVQFGIRIKKDDMVGRSEIFEKVTAWAMKARDGAWLTLPGQKEGRRAWVRVQALPAEGDQWQWTSIYSVTFRAAEVPYWQDETGSTIRRAGISSLSQQISVGGNARTVMNFSFTNGGSGTCGTVSISTAIASMTLSGLGLAAGETLVIDHTEEGILRIRIRGTGGTFRSALAARTTGSSDDLWIEAGVSAIAITCGQSGSFEIGTVGRYA